MKTQTILSNPKDKEQSEKSDGENPGKTATQPKGQKVEQRSPAPQQNGNRTKKEIPQYFQKVRDIY